MPKLNKHTQCCKTIAQYILQLKHNSHMDNESLRYYAIKIAKVAANVIHPSFECEKMINAYKAHLEDGKLLMANHTNLNGRSSKSICYTMYGLWSAVPMLIDDGYLGGKIPLSMLVNFCHDVLNWVVDMNMNVDMIGEIDETN